MMMTGDDDIKEWIDNNLCIEEFLLTADVDQKSRNKDIFGVASAEFIAQPPSNVRKSKFFNFTIKLVDRHKQPIEVESSCFLAFCDDER